MSLKDGNLTLKDYHTWKQSAILDATQRMSDQVRTIAVVEPTKPAVQIANEVMEAAIEEYEGMLKCIIWTFRMKNIFLSGGILPRTHNIIIYYIKFKRIKQTNREYVSVPQIPQSYIDFQVPEKLVEFKKN